MAIKDFGGEGLLAFWNGLSVDERQALTDNLEAFHASLSNLTARGIVNVTKGFTGIEILTDDPEVEILLALHKKIGAQGMKITDLRKKKKHAR